MAEDSILWITDGTGDGANTGYTMAELTQWLRMLWLNDKTTEGVALGFLNDLEVTEGGARELVTDTGGAVVYGYPYWSTSAVTKTLAHPVVDTTGWRLVLRAVWAAQTLRITLLESADGVAAIPDVVQNAGVTWDISIAYGTITTGDVISITDDRHYLKPNIEIDPANRTRKFLIQPIPNSDCVLGPPGVGFLHTTSAGKAAGVGTIPSIWASGDIKVHLLFMAQSQPGGARFTGYIRGPAAEGANWNTPASGQDFTVTFDAGNVNEVFNAGFQTFMAADIGVEEIISMDMVRDHDHAEDTLDATVYFIGWLLEYTGDS